MADRALEQLRRRQVAQVHIVNRTIGKAKVLADKYQGTTHVFEQLREVLPLADVLITSTGAPHTLINRDTIAMVMQMRVERKLAILDIAVPRDVDVGVDELPNVWRCDIDDLQMAVCDSQQSRESAIGDVETIIENKLDDFLEWFRGVGIEQTVVSLRRKTDEIRDSEFQRLTALLPELTAEQTNVLEKFSRSLTKKLLHDATVNLRQLEGTRAAIDHGEAIRELFNLIVEDHQTAPAKTAVSHDSES